MQHYQHASIIFQRGQVEAILPWCVLPFAIRVEAQRAPTIGPNKETMKVFQSG